MLGGGLGQSKAWDAWFIDPSRNPRALAKWKSDMAASRGGTGIIANRWYDAKKHFFLDPTLNDIRQMYLRRDFAGIFRKYPRGSPSSGVNDTHGGRKVAADMPGVLPTDPKAAAAWAFWNGRNATGKQLSLSAMNVQRSGNQIVPGPKISIAAIHDFFDNYLISRSDYLCPPQQISGMKNEVYDGGLVKFSQIIPTDVCRPPPVDKLKKYALSAVMIVAAAYLGPMIMSKVGAVAGKLTGGVIGTGGGAAGGAVGAGASTVGQATQAAGWFQKVQAGTKGLLSYVNKARTVKAIVEGKLPPPPISIAGGSFREWAFIVAKKELKDAAIDQAMKAGTKYIAKKMSEREEKKLRAEIEQMQRELLDLEKRGQIQTPATPLPTVALPTPIEKIQILEENQKEIDDTTLTTILVAAIPAILLLKGAG